MLVLGSSVFKHLSEEPLGRLIFSVKKPKIEPSKDWVPCGSSFGN